MIATVIVVVWSHNLALGVGIGVLLSALFFARKVAAVIRAAMNYVPKDKIFPCTNCGMAPLPRSIAMAKLRALSEGAALMRREVGA